MNIEELGKKKFPNWIIYVFLAFLGYLIYDAIIKKNELDKYCVSTDAEIISYSWGNKGIKNVDYKFRVGNRTIIGHGSLSYLPCERKNIEDCIGVKIIILYSKKNPEINDMIVEDGTIPDKYYNTENKVIK